ncbi:MAG: hypothetical protein K2Q32_02545 [Alphaproteobacteria bacterium]|nr:hypothetical protein [Alphaproteobacteria bacterium]
MQHFSCRSSSFTNIGLAIHSAALNLCERKDQIIIDVPAGDYSKATGRNDESRKFLSFFDDPKTKSELLQATLANATTEHGAMGMPMSHNPVTGNITWTIYSWYNPNRNAFNPPCMDANPKAHL